MVDPSALLLHRELEIAGVTLAFVSTVHPHGHVYQNEAGDEAIITFNPTSGNMFGSLKTHDGRSYGIEKCASGHTWKEYDVASFKVDKAITLKDREPGIESLTTW